MELRVSSYGSRADLEKYCQNLSPTEKEGLVIVGSMDELARFQLGPMTSVYGISCVPDDFKPQNLDPETPPERIKGSGYGLNGNLKKLN